MTKLSAADRHLRSRAAGRALLVCGVLCGCSGEFGPPVPIPAAITASDSGDAGDTPDAANLSNPITSLLVDAGISAAFFINDPAPPMCGPNGVMTKAAPIAGSAECPDDKNRTGCPCPEVGKKAACWPGKRQNRKHGVCVDGVTTCLSNTEFTPAWGACEGYVLPTEGVTSGPQACQCFSNGSWALENLVPCINTDGTKHYIYSSHTDPQAGYACEALSTVPPPKPQADWTGSSLTVDCGGQFKLCYTMKAGKASDTKPDDCTVMQSCVDVWYEQAGKPQVLPALPGWVATDSACVERFIESGGYGEMSVLGKSAECDAVDDGKGKPLVFKLTSYCPSDCSTNPTRPGCSDSCSVSGSGMF